MTTITTDSRDKHESVKQLQNLHLDIDFTVGAEDDEQDEIVVAIQVKEAKSQSNVSERVAFHLYLSDDAEGDGLIGTAPNGGVTASTGSLLPIVANKMFTFVTNASGAGSLTITHAAGAKTLYAIAVDPAGRLNVSSAITFAA